MYQGPDTGFKGKQERTMNIDDLEAFVEITRDMNMTAAAKRMYISQQTLSLKVQRLEKYYDTALFERKPHLHLTYAGEMLLQSAAVILKEHRDYLNLISDIAEKHAASLHIGITSSRAGAVFPLMMGEYTDRWPHVRLRIDDLSTPQSLPLLAKGNLDLAVVVPTKANYVEWGDKVDFETVMKEKTYLVISPELMDEYFGSRAEEIACKSKESADLRDFAHVPFILHQMPMNLRKLADDCFDACGVKPVIRLETTSTDQIFALYDCLLGAFFCKGIRIPELLVKHPDSLVFPVHIHESLQQENLCLATKRYRKKAAHLQDFCKLFQEACAEIELAANTK